MARVSMAKKQWASDGLTFAINIDEVIAALAAGKALAESVHDPRYIDAIVDEAFDEADDAFNLQAEAGGRAGYFPHMYEWGTVGINTGRTNVRLPASSPSARLWQNWTEGKGLDRTVWLAYRPSVANVPKPTAQETGMDPAIISRMRDHVFRWKARVIEEGERVEIERKRAKFLLFPAYKAARPYMRNHDIKRGYSLHKGPINASPGYSSLSGNFKKFWFEFWETDGGSILETRTNQMILQDYEPELRKPRTTKTIRPVQSVNVLAEIEKKSKQVRMRSIAKAKARRSAR